ncbi:anticodon-binding domain of a subclass of class I aminoacyl-tRNA synthetase [Dichomitus squalens]|uniref:valine--tRNA ligase n=2 Tax=Dichomitus squalens TaxID=114155 RepID=A0A4Q9PKV5_9APHY|nr:anticodon-binding domain of a subclass of class I aminoacyl-tRNA synthetase [Dichomitus squalens LYAD-421 SS1]EJF56940.1 anticodon-binding domain of a subclass of class I aminoacyl-tRNA synthetase [Dichomitus squalens LYAD-421 SS1]TBU44889.1 anticodon-binding domain of a subclass of class I aminoacyl-tRNA synthetase [Dichomitus squalens]TBU54803.1 anticodon-binding domain of a subclass of class I aminoacyl-tRNA synthetase [Dichomitus squalens]
MRVIATSVSVLRVVDLESCGFLLRLAGVLQPTEGRVRIVWANETRSRRQRCFPSHETSELEPPANPDRRTGRAAHNFWLHKLCDVHMEAMKPMTDESASETTRKSAQQTLYTCLDHGLRLLHPFMPLVTQELWQRLPRRPNGPTPSIMLSKYPTFTEHDFDLVFSTVKSARALAASYTIIQNLHGQLLI